MFDVSDEEGDYPPMAHVVKCLKEAGLYDPIMSNSEMLEIYRVLNESKSTATADEHRRTATDANSNYDFVDEMRLQSEPVKKSPEHSDQVESSMEVPETSTSPTPSPNENVNPKQRCDVFDEVDVFNSAPTKHPPLTLIRYKPKYNPPLYCDPKFVKLNLEERKRLLSEHHKRLIQIYDSFQRNSQIYAALGKPIQPDVKFHGSLLKANDKAVSDAFEGEDEDLFTEENISDIYITKTGRLTKRKLYTESSGDLWSNKSPSRNNRGSPASSTTTKRKSLSTLSNEQIIKRSKLFSPQTHRLFDKLKEKEEEDKKTKRETQKFLDSLNVISDDDFIDDSSEVVKLIHDEEPFIPRRIVPPNPMKKVHGRGGKSKVKSTSKKPASSADRDMEEEKLQSFTAVKMGTCPMCSLEFEQDALATHVYNCIDTYEERDTRTTVSFNGKDRITCEGCDQVLPLDTDYEVHVRECLAKSP